MKIAVVGSGISGLSAAWLLNDSHRVTLYEAADYLGGHTNTVDVTLDGTTCPVDTGFLVHNDLTYPNLIQLFDRLGVETYATDMSFSVNRPEHNIEWAGSSLATVFAQRRNLLRLRFWRMLQEIVAFNSRASELLEWSERRRVSLGFLLDEHGYSKVFRQGYLLPMAAAIWSSPPSEILAFPASTFLRFCINHRLLQIEGRPEWRSIVGGGRTYVGKMAESLDVRLKQPVDAVTRSKDAVTLTSRVFGVNRRRLLAFHFADHGDGRDPRLWVREQLRQPGIEDCVGSIWVQTFPRVLGCVFNPVSFWYCERKDGSIGAILAEVNNTFGEKHNYILTPDPNTGRFEDVRAEKQLYVSPFYPVSGGYRFHFNTDLNKPRVRIDYHNECRLQLNTAIWGSSRRLTSGTPFSALILQPLLTLGVTVRIHWQALRLWLKGTTYHSNPSSSIEEISR